MKHNKASVTRASGASVHRRTPAHNQRKRVSKVQHGVHTAKRHISTRVVSPVSTTDASVTSPSSSSLNRRSMTQSSSRAISTSSLSFSGLKKAAKTALASSIFAPSTINKNASSNVNMSTLRKMSTLNYNMTSPSSTSSSSSSSPSPSRVSLSHYHRHGTDSTSMVSQPHRQLSTSSRTYRNNRSALRTQRRKINTSAKANERPWVTDIRKTPCGLHLDYSLPPTFDKILIANRGEIACRVMRTCRQLGIKTVAVYSEADANSLFVKMADEAYCIGPAASAQSYLRGDHIISLAKRVGAQAIHPGYGFLSENAGFAEACFANGIEFIGPPIDAITAMGSKSASKNIMEAAGVRCVPGYHGEDQSTERLKAEADKVGYPIMLKAVLGGGGKGMRIVWKPEDFEENMEGCKREALASFKDERILLERYIQNPRHIEFQVFADKQGNAVHLYERDCSVQRRHQKVFEEAPAPGMTDELRAKMGKAATDAAQAVGYVGAGTVEFIVDADTDEFFFMEMNTRLQVEHCVSEMVVHKDLVQWQLHVAAGYSLPALQDTITAKGHALELRVYAENPRNNFFPTTGRLAYLKAPKIEDDVRVETGVRPGDEVSIHYDPMISKLVVWGPNRELCLRRMIRAIDDYKIAGLPTNLEFAKSVLEHDAFKHGQVTTKFIPQYKDELLPPITPPSNEIVATATLNMLLSEQLNNTSVSKTNDTTPWSQTSSFRLNNDVPTRRVTYDIDLGEGKKQNITVDITIPKRSIGNSKSQVYTMHIVGSDHKPFHVEGQLDEHGNIRALINNTTKQATCFIDNKDNTLHVFDNNGDHKVLGLPLKAYGSTLAAGAGAVAPMAGKVVKVNVKAGDHVKQGQALVIMEAMKMEHIIRAAEGGVVKSVLFNTGSFVEGGKPVVVFEESTDDNAQ